MRPPRRTQLGQAYQEALGGPENIVVAGPRCSGKSTLAKALRNHLAEQGYKVEVRNHRWTAPSLVTDAEIVIWDREPPEGVSASPLTRYITCGLIL